MKYLFACFFLFSIYNVYSRSNTDSLLNELNEAINNTKSFDAEKLKNIENIKRLHKGENSNSPASLYDLSSKLYEEYKIFNFDSAFLYAKRSEQIAYQLNDQAKILASKIKLSFILLSAGMFKETFDSLHQIDIKGRPTA